MPTKKPKVLKKQLKKLIEEENYNYYTIKKIILAQLQLKKK